MFEWLLVFIITQVPTASADPISLIDLLSRGSSVVLAVMAVGFITGWIVPGGVYKQAVRDNERLTDTIAELQQTLLDSVRVAGRALGDGPDREAGRGRDDRSERTHRTRGD